jgi:hypothetical protein
MPITTTPSERIGRCTRMRRFLVHSGRNHSFTPDPRRVSPSLRPGLSFRYIQLCWTEFCDVVRLADASSETDAGTFASLKAGRHADRAGLASLLAAVAMYGPAVERCLNTACPRQRQRPADFPVPTPRHQRCRGASTLAQVAPLFAGRHTLTLARWSSTLEPPLSGRRW